VARPKCLTAKISAHLYYTFFSTLLVRIRENICRLGLCYVSLPIHMMFPCFPVLPFPSMRFGPTSSMHSCVFHPPYFSWSRVFHSRVFSVPTEGMWCVVEGRRSTQRRRSDMEEERNTLGKRLRCYRTKAFLPRDAMHPRY